MIFFTESNHLWIEYKSTGKSQLKTVENGLVDAPPNYIGFKANYKSNSCVNYELKLCFMDVDI